MSGNITFIIYPQSGVSADAHYLDVSEETTIAVTYTIQDLTDITKRKGAYSKTIVLPGTENNNRAFKNAFNVQAFTGGWTPNKQITCRIFSDGVQIFSGTLQLMSISVLNDKPKYECAIYGGEIGLFKNMDDRLLCETVGVSDYDHIWERSMFPDVFTAGYYAGIVYTLIDNVGLWHCKELDSTGNGGAFSGLFAWLQAVMDRIIPLEFFKPAVFVKDLVGLIFAEHGYTYTSNFFNSDPVYDRLIIPYAGDGLMFTDEANLTFVGTNDYVEFDGEPAFDTWVATFDLTGNAGTYPYEMAGCGQYTSYTYYACSNYSGNYYIEIYFPSLGGLFNNWELTISVYDIDALTNIYDVDGVECRWTYGGNAASIEVRVSAIVNLKADQRIQIIVQRPNGSTGGEFIDASVSDAYVLIDLIKRLSFEGAYVEVSKGLPPTIKQIDLLADLQKMFNLYFYADPENPNNIIIEPFNEFYSTSPVDWSLKIDRSREINITCGDPENRKRFIFSYAQTDEAQAAEYRRDEGEQYGCRTWDTENFYGKGDEEITTKCGTLIPAQYRTNIVAARVWGLQGNGTIKEGKIGYRIAQYNYIDFVIGGNYEWWLYPDADNTIDLNSANIQTKFPYAGHVDNPFNPTEDIAFGMPKRLYWKLFDPSLASYIQYTNNNLFNKYWLNYIVEITSAEAMTLTAYFEITIRDINGLNFRRPIYYNGILWRLLEIADYEIGKNVVIKCTLRRILNLGAFVPDLIYPFQNTGTALTTENEYTPVFSHPVIGL